MSSVIEELIARHKDREENMNGGEESIKKLAAAVIMNVLRNWVKPTKKQTAYDVNRGIHSFLVSEDYLYWASLAGLDVDGETIWRALVSHNGIYRDVDFTSIGEEYRGNEKAKRKEAV